MREDDGGFGDAGIDSLEGGVGGWEELVAGDPLACGAGTCRWLKPDLRTVVEFPSFEVGDAAVVPFEAVDEEGGCVESFDVGEAVALAEAWRCIPSPWPCSATIKADPRRQLELTPDRVILRGGRGAWRHAV